MRDVGTRGANLALLRRYLGLIAACVLLAAFLSACGGSTDAAVNEKVLGLEAKLHSLEESLEALGEENAQLKSGLADLETDLSQLKSDLVALEERHDEYRRGQEGAAAAKEGELMKTGDGGAGQEERLAALEEGQARNDRRFDDVDSRLQEMEEALSQFELVLSVIEEWFTGIDQRLTLLEGAGADRTLRLAAEGGGQAQVINYGAEYGGARSAVLVLPDPLPEGEIPLVVSLHGFGGDSFFQSQYVPLHQRVNRDGFALLLPDGVENHEGQRFWNPTDGFGKANQDDAAALTALVQEARGEFNAGPVYFFGYSNGGFMSYWMACQGLPGLRAVASLAGTSYMDDGACQGATPVSVLHVHGTGDAVVRFEGVAGGADAVDKNAPGYAGAWEMTRRWALRAGCGWPQNPQPYATLDLDGYVPGAETRAYRIESGCGDGVSIELWAGEGSGHAPGYGDAFVDALLEWLLAQE